MPLNTCVLLSTIRIILVMMQVSLNTKLNDAYNAFDNILQSKSHDRYAIYIN